MNVSDYWGSEVQLVCPLLERSMADAMIVSTDYDLGIKDPGNMWNASSVI